MLKIKDNVDLKELEKFGFEKGFRLGISSFNKFICCYIQDDKKIILTNNDCWWDNEFYYNYERGQDVIYDLIKADLVEKSDDDEWNI